jgi:hypothetical protein
MQKVCVLEDRLDLIGLKLANEVPIECLTGLGGNLLGFGPGFLVAVFTKISGTECEKIMNQLVRVVLVTTTSVICFESRLALAAAAATESTIAW